MKRKMNKKVLCLCVVMLLCFMSGLVYADSPTDVISGGLSGIEPDAPHGVYYGLDANLSYVMNQSTSAIMTPSGTKVTTWTKTGHPSQFWDTWVVNKSGYSNAHIILCDSNMDLALNINRTTYAVNVVEMVGNYYRDCCFEILNRSGDAYQYYARARKTGESEKGLIGYRSNGAAFQWGSKNSATALYRLEG